MPDHTNPFNTLTCYKSHTQLTQILANPTHMHHNKHVFCVPLHVMQSWVPLHQMCKACCPQTATKRFACTYGYLHGSMGDNASHSPLHVHGRPSYMHYRRLHKCNAGVQNVPQYMEKCIKLYMIHGVSTRIAAL